MQNAGLQALSFLISAVFDVMIFFVMLRILMQFSQVHYYNPIVQLMIRLTEPMLRSLRRFLPNWQTRRWDSVAFMLLAGLVLAKLLILSALLAPSAFNLPQIFLSTLIYALLQLSLNIYFWGIIINVILSWVFLANHSPNAQRILPLYECLDQLLAPVLNPSKIILERLFGMGRFGIDFSPVLAMIVLQATLILVSGIPHLPF